MLATERRSAMKRMMVRYRVKPDQAAQNEALVQAVYKELDQQKPAGLRYATFKLDDGVTFVHLVSNETEHEQSPLMAVPAFQRFLESIGDRCDEPPVSTTLHEVGSFRFFDK
jgi:hypothetical protein